MSDSTTLTPVPSLTPVGQPSDETLFKLNRLQYLEARRREIEDEIVALTKLITIVPHPVECLRCGHRWEPYNPFIAPRCCPRCGSKLWNKPPTALSRHPSDPPAKSWRKRVGGASKRGVARAKFTRNKVLWKQTDEPKELPHWLDRIVHPSSASESGTEIAPLTPPPGIGSVIPPPPEPVPISDRGQVVAYMYESADELQPEQVASHPRDKEYEVRLRTEAEEAEVETEVMPSEPERSESDDIRSGILSDDVGGEPSPPADVTSSELPRSGPDVAVNGELHRRDETNFTNVSVLDDVPPETVGAPQTEAEREELDKAEREAWPTTRPE